MDTNSRIQQQLDTLATITAGDVGITRLAFSDEDMAAHEYVQFLMKGLGMTVRFDAFGNMIGHMEGSDTTLAPIMIGSHLDSVPQGGNFDGVVGVLVGLETVYRVWNEKQPQRSVEVIVFRSEESSRFGTGTLGSQAYIGKLDPARLEILCDANGHSLREVLQSRGGVPDTIGTPLYSVPPQAFLEVHIEQGKVLEQAQLPIGIVTGIAAPTRYRVVLKGMADHSGATPMELRHDALCGAAEIILAVEKYASGETEPPAVGTVGVIEAMPGAMNVIPGEVRLGIDLRSGHEAVKKRLSQAVVKAIEEICTYRNLTYTITTLTDETPVTLNADIIEALSEASQELHIPYKKMPSGAGHDAMFMAEIAPTGMLFIPCRDGVSHNAAEFAKTEDIVTAANVLEVAVRKMVNM